MSKTSPFSLVLHNGAFDRVHYGLIMASAAAAIGRDVTILFAGDAVQILHIAFEPPDADQHNIDRNIAGLEELLGACNDLGARMIVCETALVMAGMKTDELRADLGLQTGGFVSYLNAIGEGGHLLFV